MATQAATIRQAAPVNWGRIAGWSVIILLILLTLFPFWWVVRTALSTKQMLLSDPTSLAPVGFTIDNLRRVLGLVSLQEALAAGGSGQAINFFLFLRNSLIVSLLSVGGQLFFCSLAAYAFARLRFPMRDSLFFLYLTSMMLPGIITLIPNFILMRDLNWLNTFQGILAPKFLMTPFAVFFLRQFFLTINREVEEAAKIDGANLFIVFWRIILPIGAAPLTTLGILTFIGEWNDYYWPFLIGQDESVRVLTVALGVFRSQTPQGSPDWPGLMAGALIAMLPTLILFAATGRKAIDSIQFSGIK